VATRELKVEIIGDAKSLQRALGDASTSSGKFGSAMSKAGKAAGIAGAAIVGGFVYTLKRGFDEIAESQKVMAQTEAVIKSTGKAANVTGKDVTDLAESLSKVSGVDDEVIQGGENMLLTFTNIRNEVGKGNDIFNQATTTLLDMSTALGTDMSKSAIQLGKALNDPIKGVSALSRVGVTFTEGQKETIKSLVESGRTMDAQKMILRELNKEFGGSAKAFGDTLPGQLAKARNAFDEVAGNLAEKFLPMLTSVLDWVNKNWATIGAVFERVGDVIAGAFDLTAEAAGRLVGFLSEHPALAQAAAGAILGLTAALVAATAAQTAFNIAVALNPYVLAAGAVAALAGALAVLYLKNEQVHEAVNRAFTDIRNTVMPIIAALQAAWARFGQDLTTIARTTFATIVTLVQTWIQNMLAPIRIFLALLRGDFDEAWDQVKGVFTRTIGAITTVLRGALTIWATIAKALGQAVFDGISAGMEKIVEKVGQILQGVGNALNAAARTAFNLARSIGAAIVNGIKAGIEALWQGLVDWVMGKINSLIDALRSLLDIFSPSGVMAKEIGEPMAEGIRVGFERGLRDLGGVMGGGALSPSMAGGTSTTVHTAVYLDGRQIAEVNEKHRFAMRRAGMELA
jgi:phage-related protein